MSSAFSNKNRFSFNVDMLIVKEGDPNYNHSLNKKEDERGEDLEQVSF